MEQAVEVAAVAAEEAPAWAWAELAVAEEEPAWAQASALQPAGRQESRRSARL
ncbi:MAG: hypothetical protein HYS67_00060 [Deltaproteobacteria bacterium]|nr:hypothetical protein [Deltaproteobacteria bacterium]